MLRRAANRDAARSLRSFFKPREKVFFYGVKTPELRRIERSLYLAIRKSWSYADALAFCDHLLGDRYMETKSLGMMLLSRYRRDFQESLLTRAHSWLKANLCDNWALTDALCALILSPLLEKSPRLVAKIRPWSRSANLWVRRAGVVALVKSARQGRHLDSAYQVATRCCQTRQDLMHKAVGWLLREAGKTDAARLERYLLSHGPAVPRTTVRYAIERFPEKRRRAILERTRGSGVERRGNQGTF